MFDAAANFENARSIYWYPYLAKASDLDRPGFAVHPNSKLGKALLQWLSELMSSHGTRLASETEIEKWKTGVLEFVAGHQHTDPKPIIEESRFATRFIIQAIGLLIFGFWIVLNSARMWRVNSFTN